MKSIGILEYWNGGMRGRGIALLPYYLIALFAKAIQADEVSVDFSKEVAPVQHRACGFLHGITDTSPVNSLLTPLKIRYIRGWSEPIFSMPGLLRSNVYPRVNHPGVRLSLGLGTLYYGQHVRQDPDYEPAQYGVWQMELPGEKGNWQSWERIVGKLVRETVDQNIRCDWVVWNEPDHKKFWPADTNRYYEAFQRAYTIIKALDKESRVTGPTAATYSFAYLTAFLQYCKEKGCVPDVLTWHELTRSVPDIKGHVEEMRRWCKDNQIPIPCIVIDEYGGRRTQHLPGVMVGFISALEGAQVDAAARAIWEKSGTLCGATTEDGEKPLGVWWVYKAYSDMSGVFVQTVETENIRLLASHDEAKKEIRMLIGNQTDHLQQLRVTMKHAKCPLSLVTAKRICHTDKNPLEALPALAEARLEAVEGVSVINLGPLAAWEAAELVIRIEK
jgi:Glycosyl hydrolases family 39